MQLYPNVIPRPGKPICPNVAAKTMPIHHGCSPLSARCIDQLTEIILGLLAVEAAGSPHDYRNTPTGALIGDFERPYRFAITHQNDISELSL